LIITIARDTSQSLAQRLLQEIEEGKTALTSEATKVYIIAEWLHSPFWSSCRQKDESNAKLSECETEKAFLKHSCKELKREIKLLIAQNAALTQQVCVPGTFIPLESSTF
jgi:hypothetical protein